jgi:hypothetical protein
LAGVLLVLAWTRFIFPDDPIALSFWLSTAHGWWLSTWRALQWIKQQGR